MATKQDIEAHYDIDNDFYALFLDEKYRAYTCAVWDEATSLEDAQSAKMHRMCDFSGIKDGAKVMDVGCGWGGFMDYVVDHYKDTRVHGLTLSTEQTKYVETTKKKNVSIELCSWADYKAPEEKYDAIVSICAFEHFATGKDKASGKHRDIYKHFFDWCLEISTPDAQVSLQTITANRAPKNIQEIKDKYTLDKVFPGSALASISDIQAAVVDKYEISEVKRIGPYYVKTLAEWRKRFEANKEKVIANYGQDLYDLYAEYLAASQRCYESGFLDLYQASLKRVQYVWSMPS